MSRRKQQAPSKVQEAGGDSRIVMGSRDQSSEDSPDFLNKASDAACGATSYQDSLDEEASCEVSEEPLNLSKPKNGVQSVSDVERDKDEEHTCPTCHKTFMSKYGLVTHAEVHSTPDLNFTSHHRSPVEPSHEDDSPVLQKIKQISGFLELNHVDFTCRSFPAISERICSRSFHQLTSRDSDFFFLCKTCDRVFPTIASLNCHMRKHLGLAEDSAQRAGDSACNPDENIQTLTDFLGLKATLPSEKSRLVRHNYATKSAAVQTSPAIAALKVPVWMRYAEEEKKDCYYDTEISRDSSEQRPALKIKLVRRRLASEQPPVPKKYFIEDTSEDSLDDDESKVERGAPRTNGEQISCDSCGEFFSSKAALAGHKAASICGIGVGPSSNGRRMFWCRLCNYASCEKSTILRHQRTHTGLRPYSCKLCSIAFTTKANCERHIRKRHRVRVSNDVEVKNAVYCDYDLLRKARDGEINIPPTASVSNPAGGKYFSFVCRICKATFTSRNSGARHVMAKHSIMNRKRASEYIHCVRVHEKKAQADHKFAHKDEKQRSSSTKIAEEVLNMRGAENQENMRGTENHGSKKVGVKKLIPLLKIRSHYEASLQLAEKFYKEYSEVFHQLNKVRQDSKSLSSKLLSVIGSAGAFARPTAPISPPRISPHPADVIGIAEADVVVRDDDMHRYGNGDESDLQRFSDYDLNENHSSYDSSPSENHFETSKSSSSSLMLRTFAAHGNQLAPDFSDSTSQELAANLSKPDAHVTNSLNVNVCQEDSSFGSSETLRTWTSYTAPKLRDERGRYVRDPNSPHLSKPPKSSSTNAPYRGGHGDLPTMVPLHVNKQIISTGNTSLLGRKCPKCDKVFPWASSLSRHIMTHTGLKPYMCARCSMRFTTRSNLLRHAYRRHGLERGSNERHDVLVTLSLSEQKEHAEKEAQRLAKMGEKMDELEEEGEEQQDRSFDMESLPNHATKRSFDMESLPNHATKEPLVPQQTEGETGFYNKRYMCGMCRQPFANRSNLVRHLQRLHRITKDDPEFRQDLLIKIQHTTKMKQSRNLESFSFPDFTSVEEEESSVKEENPSLVDVSSADTNESSNNQDHGSTKLKAFTCSICSIGFTKRNNAARHIQHQHNVSRKSSNFHQLIIRNLDAEGKKISDEKKEGSLDAPLLSAATGFSSEPSSPPRFSGAFDIDGGEDQMSESAGDGSAAAWEEKVPWRKMDDQAEEGLLSRPKKKDIRLTHFICGVCKRIFKEVEELKEHLNEHNIPHPWQCAVCGVPFTNKYNCQRHLIRRHGLTSVEPKFVEDVRQGSKQPKRKGKGGAKRTLQNRIKIAPKIEQR